MKQNSHNYYIKHKEEYMRYGRNYFLTHREDFRKRCKKYSYTIKGKFNFGKRKAKRCDLLWEIDFETYQKLIKLPCTYCNKSLLSEMGIGLDRIDNKLGYIIQNVLPCCGDCNKTRGDRFTVEEMKIAIRAVLAFRGELQFRI